MTAAFDTGMRNMYPPPSPSPSPSLSTPSRSAPDALPMYLYRYVFFHSYLQLHWRRYSHGRIILTDFRDVIFQRNPQLLPMQGLHVSLESSSRERLKAETVRGVPFKGAQHSATAGWMHLCYDDADVRAVYEEPLSCSGVTWGSVLHVRMYLALMLREFVALQLGAVRARVGEGNVMGGRASATACLDSIGNYL